jgi:hypothetical protein
MFLTANTAALKSFNQRAPFGERVGTRCALLPRAAPALTRFGIFRIISAPFFIARHLRLRVCLAPALVALAHGLRVRRVVFARLAGIGGAPSFCGRDYAFGIFSVVPTAACFVDLGILRAGKFVLLAEAICVPGVPLRQIRFGACLAAAVSLWKRVWIFGLSALCALKIERLPHLFNCPDARAFGEGIAVL